MNFIARDTQHVLIPDRLQFKLMSSILGQPVVRYGIALTQAAMVAVVGVTFFTGIARLFALGLAVMALVMTPQMLKRAA
jgi:hypothetical protein